MKSSTKELALCSVLTAMAAALLFFGGVFALGFYLCPVVASAALIVAREETRPSYAWSCFVSASILGILICPDKECASMFLFLGWYPLVQPRINRIALRPVRVLIKSLILIVSMGLMYAILIYVIGLQDLIEEMSSTALWMTVATIIPGILLFYMYDRMLPLLTIYYLRRKKKR